MSKVTPGRGGNGGRHDRRPGRPTDVPHRTAEPRSRQPDPPRSVNTRPSGRSKTDPNVVMIWGFHSVREALRSKQRKLIRLSATAAAVERLAAEISERDLAPTLLTADELAARLPRDAVHQGLLLEARPIEPSGLDDLPERGILLVLDQVTDPHNVGAILRTAAAFGVVGLVTTERHSPELTGVLAKAASGGLEHVPLIPVVNLARALEEIGDRGFFRIGLDSDGAVPLASVPAGDAVALVLGAEGKGLRRLTRENCDAIARLDFPGPIKSLNVSNACAAALTVLHHRRGEQ